VDGSIFPAQRFASGSKATQSVRSAPADRTYPEFTMLRDGGMQQHAAVFRSFLPLQSALRIGWHTNG